MRQCREDHLRIVLCLLRNLLKSRWYGLWSRSISHLSLHQNVVPGFTFPTVGRLGITSPPSRLRLKNHRYYVPLRLPKALLRFVRSSLSSPDTLPAPLVCVSYSYRKTRWGPDAGRYSAGGLSSTERLPLYRIPYKETVGSPKFPSYPFENMPWSQTPVVSWTLALSHSGLLPSTAFIASAFPVNRIILTDHNYTFFGVQYRACNLDPSSFVLPLPGLHVDFTTELVANLYSGGTFTYCDHPLGNNNQFHLHLYRIPRSRIYLGTSICIVVLLGFKWLDHL